MRREPRKGGVQKTKTLRGENRKEKKTKKKKGGTSVQQKGGITTTPNQTKGGKENRKANGYWVRRERSRRRKPRLKNNQNDREKLREKKLSYQGKINRGEKGKKGIQIP